MPMIIRPMLKRDKEHICAVHSDSLTKIHSVPISIDAMMAAINALRYPLFICVRPRGRADYTICYQVWQSFLCKRVKSSAIAVPARAKSVIAVFFIIMILENRVRFTERVLLFEVRIYHALRVIRDDVPNLK